MAKFITGQHPTRGTLYAAVSRHTLMPYYGVLNTSKALAGLAPFACKQAAAIALRAAGAELDPEHRDASIDRARPGGLPWASS